MKKEEKAETKKQTAKEEVEEKAEKNADKIDKKSEKDDEKELVIEVSEKEVKEEILEEKPEDRWKRREEKEKVWIPKTKIGKLVKDGKITDIDEILKKGIKIMEEGIVDKLLNVQIDMIRTGQSKGKFGGGKRRVWRQTQRKTAEENIPSFGCLVVVGDCNGHVGIGMGKGRETLPAREKATRKAKLSIKKIERGCGSFDCGCDEKHSIPFTVTGKSSSVGIKLMPAPKGTGLVIEDECKKLMKLAGIKDIYSKTSGQTRTKYNLIKACMQALEKTTKLIK